MPDGLADSEEATEQERESDKQFDTSSGLLEKIYESPKRTNELLGDKKKDDEGFFEGIGNVIDTCRTLDRIRWHYYRCNHRIR